MKTILTTGLGVGVVSGIAAILLYEVLCHLLGVTFEQLNPTSIMIASIIVNIIGAIIYSSLKKKTSSPRMYYAMITIGVALFLSWMDWAYPPEPGIADVANPIHAIVATLSIAWIPIWINKRKIKDSSASL
ncbi:hypothetical protein [Alkalihalobacillus sp. TS-13]|uniref:hypothetical protein n=1 Tax=Alkalihalobacillus sp. TS-13 TaxID=2842455 RepID=UPI001C87CEE7|nr:hypothetical protein [Alkalihalobacillus sp. TS-13]